MCPKLIYIINCKYFKCKKNTKLQYEAVHAINKKRKNGKYVGSNFIQIKSLEL